MSTTETFSRGVFYAQKSQKNYTLKRLKPTRDLSGLVEVFWLVSWDLRDKPPHQQQNIPDPCVNLVFDAFDSRIIGAVTKRYSVRLAGQGQIFGIKFHPGGFYALTQESVAKLTDTSGSTKGYFGRQSSDWVRSTNSVSDIKSKVQLAEEFIRSRMPKSCENVEMLIEMLEIISKDTTIMRVSELADRFTLSERSLQRMFKHQIGVSPKWVIRKCRIQEVLSRLEQGHRQWQHLIDDLDYFDQSHFSRDFKSLVGVTPACYIKALADEK